MNNNKIISWPLLYKVNVTWTNSEEAIMKYLNSYKNKIFVLTQKQLAIKTHTSEATISRFCKKLGFDTYKSFIFYFNQVLLEFNQKYPIDHQTSAYTINDLLSKNIFAIKNTLNHVTMEQIEKASAIITRSKKIIVFGQGFSNRIAYELVGNLLKLGLHVFWSDDFYAIMSIIGIGKLNDLYIIFANKSQEKEICFALEEIKKSGGQSILITPNNFKLNNEAINIKIEYEKINDERELTPIASKISQSIISDALFEAILNKKPLFKIKLAKTIAVLKRWNNL